MTRHLVFPLSLLLLPLTSANPVADLPLAARNPAPTPRPVLQHRQASSTSPVPPTVASVPSYTHLGCYEDGSNHILAVTSVFDTGMTPRLCRNLCAVERCAVFGVKNAYSCLCGRSLEGFAVSAEASECDKPCRGGREDLCGGKSRMNVYSATTDLGDIEAGNVPTATGDPEESEGGSGGGSNDDGAGLSAGAIAGIAIGSAAFMALVTGAVAFLFFRRLHDQLLRRSPDAPPSDPGLATTEAQKPALSPAAVAAQKTPSPPRTTGSSGSPAPVSAGHGVSMRDSVVDNSSMGGATALDPGTPAVQGMVVSGGGTNQGFGVVEARDTQILEAPGYVPYEMPADESLRAEGR